MKNILQVLLSLDGCGIIVTDLDLVQSTLDELDVEYDKLEDEQLDEAGV